MFEAEAEEYENEHSVYDETFDMVFVKCSTKKVFQDAATFGYNKGKQEARDIINELLMNGYDEFTRAKALNFLYPDKE